MTISPILHQKSIHLFAVCYPERSIIIFMFHAPVHTWDSPMRDPSIYCSIHRRKGLVLTKPRVVEPTLLVMEIRYQCLPSIRIFPIASSGCTVPAIGKKVYRTGDGNCPALVVFLLITIFSLQKWEERFV